MSSDLTLTLFLTLLIALQPSASADADSDGIDDDFEQELLARFVPNFMVDQNDCDRLPAEFREGSIKPRIVAKNGTIYGQVFKNGLHFEIHYYHLWSRDCGLSRHDLDVEHISVLVSRAQKALYWYAAAHEGTVCDASHGARAQDLAAEERGATVWISSGKHASFLSLGNCRLGCGVDSCKNMVAMTPPKLINIGEPGMALNGADWAASTEWPLAAKMQPDFTEAVIAQLARHDSPGVTSLNESNPTVKALILGGDSALDGAILGNKHGALGAGKGFEKTGKSLVTAWRALGRALGIKKD